MHLTSKKNLTTAALILVLGLGYYFARQSGMFENPTAAGLRDYIYSCGILGPIVYMIMFSLIPSGSIIAIAGGMVFGMYFGSLYTIIGAVLGATVAFYISRLLGRGVVEKFVGGKVQQIDEGIEKGGFMIVLILRLIPIIPFNVISYGAGLTRIKYFDYILSTMIGIIPGVLVFTNLGDKALCVRSAEFSIALGILALMVIVSIFLKRRYSLADLEDMAVKRK